jgi:hypothetical protein
MQPESEGLLRGVRPDLYRVNAFRLTQLPASATEREISRQLERIKMMARLGGGTLPAGPLPLQPPPDLDAMRAATERLRDPEVRLLDEFFWFWSEQSNPAQHDAALGALGRGDLASARRTWQEALRSASPSGVALHNLAVLAHLLALDLEHRPALLGKPLDGYLSRLRDQSWLDALHHWKELLGHEGFWQRLRERIVELNEPQLSIDRADRIRAELPAALLGINAELAVQATEEGDLVTAARHRQLMSQSGFDAIDLDNALRWAVKPLRERIKVLCQTPAGPMQADNWRVALELSARLDPLPFRELDREVLQEDVAPILQKLCWFCRRQAGEVTMAAVVELHGQLTRKRTLQGESVQWDRKVIEVPRCWQCYHEHRRWDMLQAVGTLPQGIRPEAEKNEFPPVKKLCSEGWQIGTLPAGL